MQLLRQKISSIHPVPSDVLETFIELWETVEREKKTILSTPDKTDKYLYFTIEGIQKAYFYDEGKQKIVSFTQPGSFTCAPESFLTQTPSRYYFECLTNSRFCRIANTDFKRMMEQHTELQTFLNKSLMSLVNEITGRYIKQTTYTLEMKFKDFMTNRGHLINQIPQKDISNYLNVDATNFSKLMNSIKL